MINKEELVIAAFDFDGTITTKDSLLDLYKYSFGNRKFIKGLIIHSLDILFYMIGIKKNDEVKEKLFKYFFKNISENEFNTLCNAYCENRLETIINSVALEKIKWHKEKGHVVVIISASFETWIKPWANKNGIEEVICTQYEVVNNQITGNIKGKNCHGIEKVNRLIEKYPKKEEYILYAYGDSKGDLDLLKFSDHPHFKKY
nr:HAD family hydrolase [uncultured Niameybacter sp.]